MAGAAGTQQPDGLVSLLQSSSAVHTGGWWWKVGESLRGQSEDHPKLTSRCPAEHSRLQVPPPVAVLFALHVRQYSGETPVSSTVHPTEANICNLFRSPGEAIIQEAGPLPLPPLCPTLLERSAAGIVSRCFLRAARDVQAQNSGVGHEGCREQRSVSAAANLRANTAAETPSPQE